jgi:hypothetical protein
MGYMVYNNMNALAFLNYLQQHENTYFTTIKGCRFPRVSLLWRPPGSSLLIMLL